MRQRTLPQEGDASRRDASCLCPDMGRCGAERDRERDLEGQDSRCAGAEPRRVDFASAATYLPSIALVLWLTLHAASTCACDNPTTVAVVSFTASWMLGPALVGPWKQVRHGVGVWLAWIAYGELIVARLPEGAPSHTHMLVSNGCWAASVLLVTVGRRPPLAEAAWDKQHAAAGGGSAWSGRVVAATVVIFVGLFFPVVDSSFSHAHCGVRIVKAALFSGVYSAVNLLEPHSGLPELHTQRVTAATAWILLAHHNMLPAIALQLAAVLYANREIFDAADGALPRPAAEPWGGDSGAPAAPTRDEAMLRAATLAADSGKPTQQYRGMPSSAGLKKAPPLENDKVDVERLRRAAMEHGIKTGR
jgi:hypothetical protein